MQSSVSGPVWGSAGLTESADSHTKENLWHRIVPRVAGWLDFEVDSVSRYCSGLTIQGGSD